MTRTHQPASYVAECAKIAPDRLKRFIANEGPLTSKEQCRLDEVLAPHVPRLKAWMWKAGAALAVGGGAACTTMVQEAVKSLWHLITHTAP